MKLKKTMSIIAICLIMATLFMTGCANGGAAASSEGDSGQTATAAGAASGEGEEYAVIMSLNQLEFFDALKGGVNDACAEMGATWYFAGPQEAQPDKTAEAIDPVSYTHLDVYKRQALSHTIHILCFGRYQK